MFCTHIEAAPSHCTVDIGIDAKRSVDIIYCAPGNFEIGMINIQ